MYVIAARVARISFTRSAKMLLRIFIHHKWLQYKMKNKCVISLLLLLLLLLLLCTRRTARMKYVDTELLSQAAIH